MSRSPSLPPIPVPPRYRWREFRHRHVPVFVVICALVAIVMLWGNTSGSGLPGIAEGTRSTVSAPRAGYLRQLLVEPFQHVAAGTPVAVIQPVELGAELDLLQAELQIARLRLEPSIADRNSLDYERVRFDLRLQEQELALSRVNLEQAERALARNEALRKDRLVSEDVYEIARRDRDLYQARLAQITEMIKETGRRLTELAVIGEPESPGINRKAIELAEYLEDQLETARSGLAPFTLVAPIDGMVHTVFRQSGEAVLEGEALLSIHSRRAYRIVAYIRQPYRFEPEEGLPVEIVTRNRPGQRFETTIIRVGAQLESITNALAVLPPGKLVDLGLQFVLPVPGDMVIRPGELVDVYVE